MSNNGAFSFHLFGTQQKIYYVLYIYIFAGEQERDRRLILLLVVSGTFLKRTALEPT